MTGTVHTVFERPDIETASEAYAQRFAGKIGHWFLEVQQNATYDLLKSHHGAHVLDVGGGHGQIAPMLAAEGYPVTVLGSDPTCSNRLRSLIDAEQIKFQVGDPLSLPFMDRSFDVVVAYRMLAHIQQWSDFVAELARVARDAVIVDYPALYSMNYFAPLLFNWKRQIEGNTRPFARYKRSDLVPVFEQCGYRYAGHRAQFCLPMVLHRQMKNLTLSTTWESLLRHIGLTHRLGSPVIIKFIRG